ncbi:hypothetical protein [Pelotomaculum schinkii]|nr:hypothetical protein [Pelotomaculum schinkii]
MNKAFMELVNIFVGHAGDDALVLVTGYSYFLEKDGLKKTSTLQ